jgi:hypothetical protein
MAIDFPNAPTVGQTFTSSGQTWTWDGTVWAIGQPSVPAGYLPLAGGTITGSLEVTVDLLVGGALGVTGATTLNGATTIGLTPTAPAHAARKDYVDTQVATKISQTQGDARYLQLTGGTLTGALTTSTNSLSMYMNKANGTVNSRYWLWHFDSDGTLRLSPVTDAGAWNSNALRFHRDSNSISDVTLTLPALYSGTAPGDTSLITRLRGDGRYLQLAGGTMTGQLRVPAGNNSTPGISIGDPDTGFYLGSGNAIIAAVDGVAAGRITAGTGTTDGLDVITRQKGDLRYLQLTGGSLSGALTVTGNVQATGLVAQDAPGTNTLRLTHTGTAAAINNAGVGAIFTQFGGVNTHQFDTDGGLSDARSVVRRTNGDSRYLLLTGGTVTGQINHSDIYNNDRTGYGKTQINTGGMAMRFGDVDGGLGLGNLTGLLRGFAAGGAACFTVGLNGNVANTNNSYGAISDSRLKHDITDATDQLADVLAMRVVHYVLNDDTTETKQIGLIAQEVQALKPGLVDQDAETGMLGIKYSVLTPILIKAVQELAARVAALEA